MSLIGELKEMVTIRPAKSSDAPAIARVQVTTWQAEYRGLIADEFLDAFSQADRTTCWSQIMQQLAQAIYVAESERAGIVGFASGGAARQRGGCERFQGELYGLYVLPEWHGRGIGRRLVAACAQGLLELGLGTMVVWVLSDNPARQFYERLGGAFVTEGEMKIGEQSLGETAYGWCDIAELAAGAG